MRKECECIELNIKIVEESGTSLASLLTMPDLSDCLTSNDNDIPSSQLINGHSEDIPQAIQKMAPVYMLNRD